MERYISPNITQKHPAFTQGVFVFDGPEEEEIYNGRERAISKRRKKSG
jgi:hypothetical protein